MIRARASVPPMALVGIAAAALGLFPLGAHAGGFHGWHKGTMGSGGAFLIQQGGAAFAPSAFVPAGFFAAAPSYTMTSGFVPSAAGYQMSASLIPASVQFPTYTGATFVPTTAATFVPATTLTPTVFGASFSGGATGLGDQDTQKLYQMYNSYVQGGFGLGTSSLEATAAQAAATSPEHKRLADAVGVENLKNLGGFIGRLAGNPFVKEIALKLFQGLLGDRIGLFTPDIEKFVREVVGGGRDDGDDGGDPPSTDPITPLVGREITVRLIVVPPDGGDKPKVPDVAPEPKPGVGLKTGDKIIEALPDGMFLIERDAKKFLLKKDGQAVPL